MFNNTNYMRVTVGAFGKNFSLLDYLHQDVALLQNNLWCASNEVTEKVDDALKLLSKFKYHIIRL